MNAQGEKSYQNQYLLFSLCGCLVLADSTSIFSYLVTVKSRIIIALYTKRRRKTIYLSSNHKHLLSKSLLIVAKLLTPLNNVEKYFKSKVNVTDEKQRQMLVDMHM